MRLNASLCLIQELSPINNRFVVIESRIEGDLIIQVYTINPWMHAYEYKIGERMADVKITQNQPLNFTGREPSDTIRIVIN